MFYTIIKRIPGSQGTKVFVGTTLMLTVGCLPFWIKRFKNSESRAGHDLFSSEKPEAIERMEEERKEKILTKVA
ncbi:hypothetical protein NSK_002978 [Nannochloropsis salina CCMP1776]|uniref:Uncharacterized protein n=1 Tax=Nannochloropsis salina CCMP1776 TaxID=1027361 RepID=A0A4D9DA15_9STRA|nr:hypothetical protein NSK_002978 [Nannochloropsis salina CCMP1776]|eukprot:TFJ85468.1 hypothetical protein NSK_002978 [Nannochloropsis salina CCMP1776]